MEDINVIAELIDNNEKRRKNPMFRLFIYNDGVHTREYVVGVLKELGFEEFMAGGIINEAEGRGRASLGSFTKADLAEKKKILALRHIRHVSESEFV
jgi:ATP-dependent Clp protease adapter protein ClpS